MKINRFIKIYVIIIISFNFTIIKAQEIADDYNPIHTAAGFLTIAPDARAAGMGNIGVATSPDVNSLYWNTAKYALSQYKYGATVSYIPWLRNLVPDVNITVLNAYTKFLGDKVLAFGLQYYSMGSFSATDENGFKLQDYYPNEFAASLAYAMPLGANMSAGITFKYIKSSFPSDFASNQLKFQSAKSFAADISFFYNQTLGVGDISAGLCISNIGSKMSYIEGAEERFLPTNLKFGTAFSQAVDGNNVFVLGLDINKLLVPTPPEYDGQGIAPENIVAGKDPNVSVSKGIFQSFSDAPGGSSEEFHEFSLSVGLEYWYKQTFALRFGYKGQHETKGNEKYLTTGLGIKLENWSLDFSYLIGDENKNPLANTMHFTASFFFK